MKKLLFLSIVLFSIFVFSSCSSIKSTTQTQTKTIVSNDTLKVAEVPSKMNEMLESARRDYVNALSQQKLGFKVETLNYFE